MMVRLSVLSGFVNVDEETKLYYETAGAGQSVVLVHAHSVDRRMWDAQFAHLASSYHVVRYDMRGYGLSSMPRADRNYLHAEDLYKLIVHLGITQAHIVGLSLGSFVALDFMHLYSENTLSVAVAAGAIYADESVEEDQETMQDHNIIDITSTQSAPERQHPDILKRVDEWFESLMDSSGAFKDAIHEPLWCMINDWSAWTFRYKEPKCLLGHALTHGLRKQYPCLPILVIIGSNDAEGSISSSEKLLSLVPSARRAEIPNVGHFSNMERPNEFNYELEKFYMDVTGLKRR
ncbi:alpha/beta fold hydrolase [Paenibacillus harenae]|uniref:alpha/beta fold hydrolase n=1 Tax=Paenibacillus harenae TaxID=306543 RepID=UPI000424D588|nr:alpha/beta hydrolase [Paenibacillus harenae]